VAANQKYIRPSRQQDRGGTALVGSSLATLVVRHGPAPAPGSRLGTSPIQKPPSRNFYRAGEYCPQLDAGKTTQDSIGRTLIGKNDNGLRWEYA
jgi:hypothetical protein